MCVVTLLTLREAMVAQSALTTLGCAAVVACAGGFSLCICGLELLACVVVATYVVVFLVLFAITLGWRGAEFGNSTRAKTFGLGLVFVPILTLVVISTTSYAPLLCDTAAVHSSHLSVVGLTQVSFVHVLQTTLSRLFVVEVLVVNLLLLVGFQLVSSLLMVGS